MARTKLQLSNFIEKLDHASRKATGDRPLP
jgi:hypothetical protein